MEALTNIAIINGLNFLHLPINLLITMKCRILMDNTPDSEGRLQCEHGLSLMFSVGGQQWLLDTGATGLFAENAQQIGIDLNDIDYLVLTHAHYDHTGGLEVFLKENDHAPVFLSDKITDNSYYSKRNDGKRNIGIRHELLEKYPERFLRLTGNRWITPDVAVISSFGNDFPKPKGNRMLYHRDHPDTFNHELALVVRTCKGNVVFTGCAHNGLLNILHAAQRFAPEAPIIAAIGGTHLIDPREGQSFESEDEIKAIANALTTDFPGIRLITGHCTGQAARQILMEKMGIRLEWFCCGYEVEM